MERVKLQRDQVEDADDADLAGAVVTPFAARDEFGKSVGVDQHEVDAEIFAFAGFELSEGFDVGRDELVAGVGEEQDGGGLF